jgi:signal transduction histidine kinase
LPVDRWQLLAGRITPMMELQGKIMNTNSYNPTDTPGPRTSLSPLTPDPGLEAAGKQVGEEPLDLIFERVERAKQEWEATVDALPDLICLLDAHGCIVRANRTVETWELGHVTDVSRRPFHQVIHPGCEDLFCNIRRFVDSAVRTGDPLQASELEVFDARLDRSLKLRARPVAAHGSIGAATVVVISDVTEARQNQESLERYAVRLEVMNVIQRAILAAHSPEAIARAALSHLQALIPFSQATIRLYEIGTDEYLVLDAYANGQVQVEPARRQPAALLANRSLKRSIERHISVTDLAVLNDLSDDERRLRQAGLRSYVSFPMVAEGQFIGALCLASNRVNAFHQEHLEIAREVSDLLTIATCQAQLYLQLKEANAGLQHALHAKQQLIQNVSHELRTPIGVIYGYTGLLEEGEMGPLTPDQKQALTIMLKQEEQLHLMVERLIDLRSADTAQVCPRPIEMADWLAVVLRPWHKRAALTDRMLRFELELPEPQPTWLADGELLKQVLDNLLDNAFKFSQPGQGVRVVAKIDRDTVLLGVFDEGVGLLTDQIDRVFERFYQVDGSATRRFGGMGIGLALCQEIVEAHGGRIWAESAGQRRGSTFWCALPLTMP